MLKPIDSFPTSKSEQIVVIKLWEIYVLYHPSNLYRLLTEASIDDGPLLDIAGAGRVIFRFEKSVWDEQIKSLLYQYRIPVVINTPNTFGEKVMGRQPVLR